MVATALRNVRGRLCQRSDPEPIGCSAESNQPHVIPFGADNSGSQIAVFWSAVIAAKCASSKLGHDSPWLIAGFGNIATLRNRNEPEFPVQAGLENYIFLTAFAEVRWNSSFECL